MTQQQIESIPFHFSCHLNMEHEHASTYVGDLPGHFIGYCVHTPYKDGIPTGRTYTHYKLDKQVFTNKKKFLDALLQLELKEDGKFAIEATDTTGGTSDNPNEGLERSEK